MDLQAIFIYCLCSDVLQSINHKDNELAQMSSADKSSPAAIFFQARIYCASLLAKGYRLELVVQLVSAYLKKAAAGKQVATRGYK